MAAFLLSFIDIEKDFKAGVVVQKSVGLLARERHNQKRDEGMFVLAESYMSGVLVSDVEHC